MLEFVLIALRSAILPRKHFNGHNILPRFLVVILVAATIGWVAKAEANDTTVSLGVGGLVFEKSADLAMKSEVLRISPDQVDVQYVFQNVGNVDVTTTVAFPLPDIDTVSWEYVNYAAISPAPNIVSFKTWVDQNQVVPSVEERAFLKDGREITTQLRAIGIEPRTIGRTDPDDLQPSKYAELRALFAELEGRPDSDEIRPEWIMKIKFYWTQIFPAGSDVHIRHVYKPVAAGGPKTLGDLPTDMCADAALKSALARSPELLEPLDRGEAGHDWIVRPEWVDYVLTTGGNWAGPIRDFALILDKGNSDLLSVCDIPGLRLRKSGNTFVASTKDYVPKADLRIYFFGTPCKRYGYCPATP